MKTTRRGFLAGAVPLALALPLRSEVQDAEPPWAPEALARMKAEDRLGLALRIPREPEQRCWLGHLLTDLLNPRDLLSRETRSAVLILCFEEEAFYSRYPINPENLGALLLNPDGIPLEGRPRILKPYDELWKSFRALVEGADGARFRARAYAACAKADEATRNLVARLTMPREVETLVPMVGKLLPWLAYERRTADAYRAGRLEEAIRLWHERLPEDDREGPPPYGVRLGTGAISCGHRPCCEERSSRDVTCACGVSGNSRRFIRFGSV